MALSPKFLGSVNFGMEATDGTAVAENATATLSFTEASITDTPVMGEFEGLGAGLTSEQMYMLGRDVTYSLAGTVMLDDIGYLCAHGYGGYTFATATHTWSGADYSDATRENNLQPWSIIENQNFMGEGSAHSRRAVTCYASTFEISGAERAPLMFKVDGNAFSVAEYATDATCDLPAENPLLFERGVFLMGIGTETPATAIYPTEMTITVNHNSQTKRNMTQAITGYDTGAILSGKREVTGSIKIPLESDNIWDLLGGDAGDVNSATSYLSFSATWSVSAEVFAITIPKAKITNSPHDSNDGSADPYYLTLEFKAYSSDPTFALTDTAVEDTYHVAVV